jgi:hypothetical protein
MGSKPVDFTATLLGTGKVLISGGTVGAYPNSHTTGAADLYDPLSGTWAATGSMNTSRALHKAVLLQNGEVLVSGGQNLTNDKLTYLASAELYTP